jgi:hypothetical protein
MNMFVILDSMGMHRTFMHPFARETTFTDSLPYECCHADYTPTDKLALMTL